MVDFTLFHGGQWERFKRSVHLLDSVLKGPSGCWTEVELLGTGKNGGRTFEGAVVVIRREVMVVEMGDGNR